MLQQSRFFKADLGRFFGSLRVLFTGLRRGVENNIHRLILSVEVSIRGQVITTVRALV